MTCEGYLFTTPIDARSVSLECEDERKLKVRLIFLLDTEKSTKLWKNAKNKTLRDRER